MILERVLSGGQTGADQAGWRAAKAVGIPTGGWMPKEFKTEDGARPEFAELYGAKEHESSNYSDRTAQNVHDSDVTIWLGRTSSPGYAATHRATRRYRTSRAIFVAFDGCRAAPAGQILDWMAWHSARVLNVAGNRESSYPGIGEWAESYLAEVFRMIRIESA
ncbi:MAG: YpsA SLOG family protein [Isosphaeraceae bacterium]